MIIGAADENLLPRFRVSRREIMAVRELVDFLRSQPGEKLLRQLAQERIAQSVDAFEMLEEKNQSLEMRGLQFAVDAVERMRDRMGDRSLAGDNACRSKMLSRSATISACCASVIPQTSR